MFMCDVTKTPPYARYFIYGELLFICNGTLITSCWNLSSHTQLLCLQKRSDKYIYTPDKIVPKIASLNQNIGTYKLNHRIMAINKSVLLLFDDVVFMTKIASLQETNCLVLEDGANCPNSSFLNMYWTEGNPKNCILHIASCAMDVTSYL